MTDRSYWPVGNVLCVILYTCMYVWLGYMWQICAECIYRQCDMGDGPVSV